MDQETKNYLDAKVDAVKAQNDARFAEVLTGIDKINSSLSAHGEIVKNRLSTIDQEIRDAKDAANAAETASKSVKWNNITTGIAVVGVLLAAWAIWAQGVEMVTGLFDQEAGK